MQTTHFAVEIITPEQAATYLLRNERNRPINNTWITAMSRSMSKGEWRSNGEAIKFADTGRLLDGQQRMRAIIMAGLPQKMAVVRGLDENVFDTLDQGKKRTVGDVFAMAGEKNYNLLASTARSIAGIRDGGVFTSYRSAVELEDVVITFPEIRTWCEEFVRSKCKSYMTSAFPAVLTLGSELHGIDTALEFMTQVSTGANLNPRSPALVLRERMIESHTSSTRRLKTNVVAAITVKAWNAHAFQKPVSILRLLPDEAFPEVR